MARLRFAHLIQPAGLAALLSCLMLASACARGARPVATDETRPLASEQGTRVLAERIQRSSLDAGDAPELLPNIDRSASVAFEQETSSPPRLAVLEPATPVIPTAGSALSALPVVLGTTGSSIERAWIECGVEGLRIWTAVSPPGTAVTARVTLPTTAAPIVYEATAVSAAIGATPGEWNSFPGDPSSQIEQIDALCLEQTWPLSLAISADHGRQHLRAELRVEVSDEGWTDTHLAQLPVLIPDAGIPVVPVPWRAANGMEIGAVVLRCTAGSVTPLLEISSDADSLGESRQYVSVAGFESVPRSYTASGRVSSGTISELTQWMNTGAPEQVELVEEICNAETWRVYVAASDGTASQIKVLVDAPVLNAIPSAE